MNAAHDERNRLILRRTLCAVSHLYAAWSLLLAVMFLSVPPVGEGVYASRTYGSLMAAHGVLLAGAGWALWKPRPGAWGAVALAGAGSLFFAGIDVLRPHWENAVRDVIYPALAVALFLGSKSRPG